MTHKSLFSLASFQVVSLSTGHVLSLVRLSLHLLLLLRSLTSFVDSIVLRGNTLDLLRSLHVVGAATTPAWQWLVLTSLLVLVVSLVNPSEFLITLDQIVHASVDIHKV